MLPFSICVVSFGSHTPVGTALFQEMKTKCYTPYYYDLKRELDDPRKNDTKVHWHVDGSHSWTQRAVYSQSNFVQLIINIVEDLGDICRNKEDPCCRICLVYCRTGYHRGDTTGRTLKEAMNRVMCMADDDTKQRTFNVLHIPLCDVCPNDVASHIKLAEEWVQDPFCLQRGGDKTLRENLYAYDACCTRREAKEHFDELYDYIDNCMEADHVRPAKKAKHDDAQSSIASLIPEQPKIPPPASLIQQHKKRRMAKSKEEQRPLEVVKPWQSNDEEMQNKRDLSYLKATLQEITQLYDRPHESHLRKQVQAALHHFGIQQIDEEKLKLGDYDRLDQACKTVAELIYEVECMLNEPPTSMFATSDKPKQAETSSSSSLQAETPPDNTSKTIDAVQKRSLQHDQACMAMAELMDKLIDDVECKLRDPPIATSDKPKQAEKPPGKSSSGCVRGAPR